VTSIKMTYWFIKRIDMTVHSSIKGSHQFTRAFNKATFNLLTFYIAIVNAGVACFISAIHRCISIQTILSFRAGLLSLWFSRPRYVSIPWNYTNHVKPTQFPWHFRKEHLLIH
jgi:hypothetical protein